jgi:hypothetical protein
MVVIPPPLFAPRQPFARFAVLVRIGIVFQPSCLAQRLQKLPFDAPEIGRVIGKPVLLRFEIGPGHHDKHMLRRQTLNFPDEVGVEAKLQDGPRFRFPGQLCVNGFI